MGQESGSIGQWVDLLFAGLKAAGPVRSGGGPPRAEPARPARKAAKAAILALGAALCLARTPVAAAAAIPDTPAGRQLSAWLEVFNTGDEAAIQRFMKQEGPADPGAADLARDMRQGTGTVAVFSVEASSPQSITAILMEQAFDGFDRLTLTVEPEAPHHILTFEPRMVARPAEAAALPELDQQALIAALAPRLRAETTAQTFSGAVLISRAGRPVFAYAGGLADRDRGTPNRLDTRFRLASMGKMFTMVAVAQLAEAGKLDLDAPFGAYVKDFPNRDAAARVTINQLLTHTGGTGDFFGPLYDAQRGSLRTVWDYIALFGARPLRFEPGSRREYSNFGFIILGAVIERVSGEAYDAYLQRHIFAPAGMTRTGNQPETVTVAGRAQGYERQDGVLRPRARDFAVNGTSAGGGYATVGDLVKFSDALTSNRLLSPKYTALITRGTVAMPSGETLAYDFVHKNEAGVGFIGHGGAAPGVNGDLMIFPDSGYVVAVLSNFGPPWQKVGQFIGNRLPRGPAQPKAAK